MAGGRPSQLTDKVMEQAKKLALLGLTDKQMADIWGVCEATINSWKKSCPEFLESIKVGKEEADAKVAQALYHRATGYKHEAVKIFCNKDGEVTEVPYVEHYPPDTTAGIFWLKNRQPKEWRDRHEVHTNITGEVKVKHIAQLLDGLSPETLQIVEAELEQKQITGGTE